jgi:hypothetical protein
MLRNLLIICATAFLFGCNLYPEDSARTEDLDSVLTLFDRATDLSDYITYALSDELLPITPDTSLIEDPGDILNPDPAVLQFILDQIEENMDARGYQRVDEPEDADLLVGGGYVVVENTGVGSYPCGGGWWWGYPGYGWGYPGYGWGYPGYGYWYPWDCIYTYSYDVGTVLMTIFDHKNFDEDLDAFPILWLGVLRGLAGSNDLTRVDRAVDQAFDQSPILDPSNN